jgi:DNA-binding winged helix-turn-helix (wHTH) protein
VLRYRFGDFIVSPRRRVVTRQGREQPLIPRYFDLLVHLIEHRHEAVHRRDIFDRVWRDVVVSDGALSQAIRTIRRTLGDDSREPRFIRTVSRHGYQFVFADVVEEEDDGAWSAEAGGASRASASEPPAGDSIDSLIDRLTRAPTDANGEEAQREAAEMLHALGTAEALRRLGTRPRHAFARALLRDTRWDSAEASDVPIIGSPAPIATAGALIAVRLRRAARLVAARWAGASIGGGVAGLAGGVAGGLLLVAAPGSAAPLSVCAVLALAGAVCGGVGGAGVGAGLSVAEAIARTGRTAALVAGGAAGGGIIGAAAHELGRLTLAELVGVHLAAAGGLEGVVIGGTAALGYALATSRVEGLAAPRGRRRVRVAGLTAAACGLGALVLALSGHPLVGGTIHAIAAASRGSQAALTPVARLIGEPDFGPVTSALIGMGEGVFFGAGLAFGLTRRPR